ncbi:MAG: SpaH/EbpB family LPXTG-anchored major pilin [Eubacteriales bacterium]|nr:SpaH/EbpB family LPXTG-anchored major pilin [Eubacteriales bacterium]
MKNNLKKCLALLLSVVMVLAMTVTVFATDSQQGGSSTLTITNGIGNTYSVYQIATFDVETLTEGETNSTVYTNIVVADAYADQFNPDAVKNMGADELVTLSNTLASITANPIASKVTDGTVTGLKTGYYLIKETAHASNDAKLATKYILVAVDKEAETVTLKTSEPSITKKIVLENSTTNVDGADAADTLVDDNVVAIGDIVTYQIDATIPEYPSYATDVTYTITDTMSAGLTPCEAKDVTVAIKGTNEENYTPYKKEGAVSISGQTITITISSDKVIATPGGAVRVTLSGTLNTSANVGSTGNPNSVDLTYTNNWDENTTHKTPEDTVITYTGKLNIVKVDSVDTTKKLSGAEFAVYGPKNYNATAPTGVDATISVGEEGAVTYYYHSTITTGKDGTASISGLDAGTYYAVETKAPSGYSVDATPQEIALTVSSTAITAIEKAGDPVTPSGTTGTEANQNAANTYTVTWSNTEADPLQIDNTKGTTLPGTGGIGTTLFTFGGLALVILAAVLFIVYTKKQRKQA